MIIVNLLSKGEPIRSSQYDPMLLTASKLRQRIEAQVQDANENGTVNVNVQGSVIYLKFENISERLIQEILIG